MRRILLVLAMLVWAMPALFAQTQPVPSLMNFQGRLAKPDGTPLPDGTHTVTFTLFTQATGGTPLWTETETVTVHNGTFTTLLGKTTPLTDSVFAANDWLEIRVDGGAALTPRQPLVSVASAFKADTALTVPDGSITLSKIAGGVLNFANIGGTLSGSQFAAGTIPTNALVGNPFAALGGFSVGPTLLSSIATGATPTSVAVSGTTACVVNHGSGTLQVFNVSNPIAPTPGTTLSLGYPPFWVAAAGHYAYVVGSFSVTQPSPNPPIILTFLSVVDISNPAAATVSSAIELYSVPTFAPVPVNTIAVSGNTAFITDSLFNAVFIVNISNPASPSIAGSVGTGASPRDIAVSGNYAYVVNVGANTLQVFNVSNPASPSVAGTVATQTSPNSIAVSGNYAYVLANGTNTLQVFNVSNPASPTLAGGVGTDGSPNRVVVSGGSAYVVNGLGNDLQVYSLSNPASPSLTQTVATDNNPWGLAVANNLAYLTGFYDDVLQIFTLNGTTSTSLQFANGISTTDIYSPTNILAIHARVGIGTNAPNRDLTVFDANGAYINAKDGTHEVLLGADGNGGIVSTMTNHDLQLRAGGNVTYLTVKANGNVGVGTGSPAAKFEVNGIAQMHGVNIIGGSDVAEPYTVAAAGKVKPLPGMVVVMDAAHVGRMRVATKAYDVTVGGIISGANGVQPGITLTQRGTLADGSMPVASVGRVWCWCDADANGSITPGSLLTTSNTPGYAMRVTNFHRANGAIIGKAMSALKHGKGLVLVLVSLK